MLEHHDHVEHRRLPNARCAIDFNEHLLVASQQNWVLDSGGKGVIDFQCAFTNEGRAQKREDAAGQGQFPLSAVNNAIR